MVSLRLVSYSEAKAATYAQGGNGTTSGGRAKDVSDNEDGCPNKLFQPRLEQNMADNYLSPLVQKMADVVFFWQASFTKK